jgi:hypothetical protein
MAKKKAAPPKDQIEVGITSHGIKVRSVGDAAGRLSGQLADLLSPLTEGAGYVGDKIRLFRQKATIEALQRAHKVASERGYKLGPVPPRFLVEWLEGASLQDDKDEGLKDLWAKLLASGSKEFKTSYISYVDLLKKIGPKDAEILEFLSGDTNPEYSREFYRLYDEKRFLSAVPERVNLILKKNKELTFGELVTSLEGLALQFNYQLLYVTRPGHLIWPTTYFKENEKSCAVLEREGVVRIRVETAKVSKTDQLHLGWLEITKFGFDFVWACHGYVEGTELREFKLPEGVKEQP